jgi:hypothetical protein
MNAMHQDMVARSLLLDSSNDITILTSSLTSLSFDE